MVANFQIKRNIYAFDKYDLSSMSGSSIVGTDRVQISHFWQDILP